MSLYLDAKRHNLKNASYEYITRLNYLKISDLEKKMLSEDDMIAFFNNLPKDINILDYDTFHGLRDFYSVKIKEKDFNDFITKFNEFIHGRDLKKVALLYVCETKDNYIACLLTTHDEFV